MSAPRRAPAAEDAVLAAHPLADGAGPGWVATETRAEVVALTPAMSDFLHRGATDGARPIVVSDEHARLTQPLREALDDVGGHWVVRTDAGGFYDARSGAVLAAASAVLDLPRRPTEGAIAPEFLRAALSTSLRIVVSVSTRHRVSRDVRLGGVAESLATSLTGSAPVAWGATEPVVADWDRDQLTAYSRRRMPLDSRWIAVGTASDPLVGTIAVARTTEGVEETTRVSVDRGGPGDPRHGDLAADVRESLTACAAHGMPLLGFAFGYVGAPDLAARPVAEPAAQPLALLLGPPAVRLLSTGSKGDARGIGDRGAPARLAERLGGELIGRPRLPGLLLPLGSTQGGGWERLGAVMSAFDGPLVAEALGLAPRLAVELARTEERAAGARTTADAPRREGASDA